MADGDQGSDGPESTPPPDQVTQPWSSRHIDEVDSHLVQLFAGTPDPSGHPEAVAEPAPCPPPELRLQAPPEEPPAAPPAFVPPPMAPMAARTGRAPSPARCGRQRHTVLVVTTALALLAGIGVGAYVALGNSPGASAAETLSSALTDSLQNKSADVALNISVTGAGATATIDGNGAVDFADDTANLTMAINERGQALTERVIYEGGTAYINMGGLVGYLVPGKSWVSLTVGQVGAGIGGIGTGGGTTSNPTAMLKVLSAAGNDVTSLGPSNVDGDAVQGYSVHLTQAQVEKDLATAHLPSWMEQAVSGVQHPEVTYRVFIDGSGLLQSMTGTVDFTDSGESFVERIATGYSSYGTSVSVVDPPASQVVPFEQFVQAADQKSGTTTA